MDLDETAAVFRRSATKVPSKKSPLEWGHILGIKLVRVRIRSTRGTSAPYYDNENSQVRNRYKMSDGIEVVAFDLPVLC